MFIHFCFRPTFVHKLLIKNTIEENIHQAITANADNWDSSKVTLQNLITLFEKTEKSDTINDALVNISEDSDSTENSERIAAATENILDVTTSSNQ